MPMPMATGPGRPGLLPALALSLVLLAALAYAIGVLRLHRRGDAWPVRRIVAAGLGLGGLAAVHLPPLAGTHAFAAHAVRHLLLAMAAPAALALSAPITLALRTTPRPARSLLLAVTHSPAVRLLTRAPVVLALDLGAMAVFYLTPLYAATHAHPWLNALVHVHMFLAGCLLSWYLVSVDPMPGRASVRTRLGVLLVAAGSHDLLAKLMYARLLPRGAGPAEQLQLGAQILYYGGDAVEIMLAVAVLSTWYARTGRRLRQDQRRTAPLSP